MVLAMKVQRRVFVSQTIGQLNDDLIVEIDGNWWWRPFTVDAFAYQPRRFFTQLDAGDATHQLLVFQNRWVLLKPRSRSTDLC